MWLVVAGQRPSDEGLKSILADKDSALGQRAFPVLARQCRQQVIEQRSRQA
jgi:hypothetical protein